MITNLTSNRFPLKQIVIETSYFTGIYLYRSLYGEFTSRIDLPQILWCWNLNMIYCVEKPGSVTALSAVQDCESAWFRAVKSAGSGAYNGNVNPATAVTTLVVAWPMLDCPLLSNSNLCLPYHVRCAATLNCSVRSGKSCVATVTFRWGQFLSTVVLAVQRVLSSSRSSQLPASW